MLFLPEVDSFLCDKNVGVITCQSFGQNCGFLWFISDLAQLKCKNSWNNNFISRLTLILKIEVFFSLFKC